jgi:hypothetical protein
MLVSINPNKNKKAWPGHPTGPRPSSRPLVHHYHIDPHPAARASPPLRRCTGRCHVIYAKESRHPLLHYRHAVKMETIFC